MGQSVPETFDGEVDPGVGVAQVGQLHAQRLVHRREFQTIIFIKIKGFKISIKPLDSLEVLGVWVNS